MTLGFDKMEFDDDLDRIRSNIRRDKSLIGVGLIENGLRNWRNLH